MSTLSSDPWMISAPQMSTATPSPSIAMPGNDADADEVCPRDLGKVGIVLCAASSLVTISSVYTAVSFLVA